MAGLRPKLDHDYGHAQLDESNQNHYQNHQFPFFLSIVKRQISKLEKSTKQRSHLLDKVDFQYFKGVAKTTIQIAVTITQLCTPDELPEDGPFVGLTAPKALKYMVYSDDLDKDNIKLAKPKVAKQSLANKDVGKKRAQDDRHLFL